MILWLPAPARPFPSLASLVIKGFSPEVLASRIGAVVADSRATEKTEARYSANRQDTE
jgi:hypothetical protein